MDIHYPPFGSGRVIFFGGGELKLLNVENGRVLAEEVHQAHTFVKRLKGWMFKPSLPSGQAVHLQPCRRIHTFFMNFAIDVLYLNAEDRIIAVEKQIPPGQWGKRVLRTRSVVELPAGIIEDTRTEVGHAVRFDDEK